MTDRSTTVADKLDDDILDDIKGDENTSNPLKQIKQRIDDSGNTRSLYMNRVPADQHEDFMVLAEKRFADDYGMALAFLVDYFKMTEQHKQEVRDVGSRLESRLDDLEDALEDESQDDDQEVSTING